MPSRPTLPRTPAEVVTGVRQLAEKVTARRVERDYRGWTAQEVVADRAHGDPMKPPVRRAGHDIVTRLNALAGSLPVEALVLGRAITDTAPPLGAPMSPALRDLLGKYVPESIDAYVASTRRGPHAPAQELLLTQFRLLFDVASHIERAENEHDERALVIQARFLRERFAEISRTNDLDVGATPPAPRRPVAPQSVPTRPAYEHGRSFLQPHRDPVVLIPRGTDRSATIRARLALPKGYAARIGAVTEQPSGATAFVTKNARRLFAARRNTGFEAAQTDLSLTIDLAREKRVLLYAYGFGRPVLPTTTFITASGGSQVELATTLLGRGPTPLTVIASGLVTPEGIVLRNEGTVWPDLRSACEAYDVRRISWRDAHTPFV